MGLEFLKINKNKIKKYLEQFISQKKIDCEVIKPWGIDVLERIAHFTSGGKMIRGGLILLINSFLRPENEDDAVKTAAAIELVQTSLLIHDDIIDCDISRRGNKTIFYQYKELGDLEKIQQAYHFGESMGICAGDVGYFLAFEILSELDSTPDIRRKIISLFSKELALVGLGQMKDVYSGMTGRNIGYSEIEQIYLYKTARYTFSLPMMLGAILGGGNEFILSTLSQLGEKLGIIFQIKDDELGLYGTEEQIGKPIGSDIQERKKTLYYSALFQKANEKDLKRLNGVFGNTQVSQEDILFVREMIQKYKIKEMIDQKVSEIVTEAEYLIQKTEFHDSHQHILKKILDFNLKRVQ